MKNKIVISSGIAHNALASSTIVKGNINAEEDFRIDGKVEGQIECAGKLVIGPQAVITGDINCQNMDVLGMINGNLIVRELLSIKASGNICGEVMAVKLEVEQGATLNGNCKMQP
ncbi:MAG: polymer-forming cytoskeletal protein [Candidatus Symbiothrix sp.]|jgi:cytoskeletal protein CcmA (bactofilin family)|nr:polymer-forming cytoskeletal protein [Candidatus Symbiothrix sp.]